MLYLLMGLVTYSGRTARRSEISHGIIRQWIHRQGGGRGWHRGILGGGLNPPLRRMASVCSRKHVMIVGQVVSSDSTSTNSGGYVDISSHGLAFPQREGPVESSIFSFCSNHIHHRLRLILLLQLRRFRVIVGPRVTWNVTRRGTVGGCHVSAQTAGITR